MMPSTYPTLSMPLVSLAFRTTNKPFNLPTYLSNFTPNNLPRLQKAISPSIPNSCYTYVNLV